MYPKLKVKTITENNTFNSTSIFLPPGFNFKLKPATDKHAFCVTWIDWYETIDILTIQRDNDEDEE